MKILVEPKTLWVLGMPLILPSCCLVVLFSTTVTLGFRLDHRLVRLGSNAFSQDLFNVQIPKNAMSYMHL